jgi:tryptophan 2,3-dioxygenase
METQPMTTPVTPKRAHASHSGGTVYERYLRTDELLRLQKTEEERLHPDELTFQVVHQTFELWWKVTAQQLAAASDWLNSGRADEAAAALRRAVTQQELLRQVIRQLEFVSPVDFLTIRAGLEDGSGMDSPGFRAILRTAPALWSTFTRALSRAGLPLEDAYLQRAHHLAWYECAEALLDFDEQFHLLRAVHLKLAERHLGLRAVGTGGTQMGALEQTLHDLLFPDLWAVRDVLLARAQERGATRAAGEEPHTLGGH